MPDRESLRAKLVALLEEEMGETYALPQDDPKQRKPDITKAKKLLGWEPKIALREGLGLSVEYFKKQVVSGK